MSTVSTAKESTVKRQPPTFLKAIAAFLTTALGGLSVAMADPRVTSFGQITDAQWLTIAGATLAATLAVYGLKNGEDPNPNTSTPDPVGVAFHDPDSTDAGYVDPAFLVGLLVGFLLAVVLLWIV